MIIEIVAIDNIKIKREKNRSPGVQQTCFENIKIKIRNRKIKIGSLNTQSLFTKTCLIELEIALKNIKYNIIQKKKITK